MITLRDVEQAMTRIRDSIYTTPFVMSQAFSEMTGASVFFKLENLQMTGSFKERGALNKILTLTEEERKRGVIAASAGNHAQAVAHHSTKRGIRAQICMPLHTPLVKVSATARFGGEVILHGTSYDEAFQEAQRRAEAESLTLLHAFDDDMVIAGQGTLANEMLQQNPFIEAIVSPIGGGGLIGGLALAIKETNPKIKVIGVQTARVPSMIRAREQHHPVTLPAASTIADGIAVRRAGELTLPLVEKYVDDIVTVEEEEIAYAILMLLEREKTVAEGAGAAALAAMLQGKIDLKGKRTGVLVCGGNIDVTMLSRIIERGLVKDGRLVRLRIPLPDHPGALLKLTGVIAQQKANIVATTHDRAYYGVSLSDTVVDITMETRGAAHVQELISALSGAGYQVDRVK